MLRSEMQTVLVPEAALETLTDPKYLLFQVLARALQVQNRVHDQLDIASRPVNVPFDEPSSYRMPDEQKSITVADQLTGNLHIRSSVIGSIEGTHLSPSPKLQSTDDVTCVVDSRPELYGWVSEHRVLGVDDTDIWASVRHLGHGSFGSVDEVRRTNTKLPTVVLKRVKLGTQKKKAQKILSIIREEAATLGRLRHQNIVTLVGSYEDRTNPRYPFYCLLMLPVGENHLEGFLEMASEPDLEPNDQSRYRSWIQSWYANLASALAYMHDEGVQHQDIKPTNIIHRGDHIFFTDFSSARNFKVGQTTSTANPGRSTAMYAAPEYTLALGNSTARFGRAFDVFGLGCVFCDMLTVENNHTVSDLHDFLLSVDQATEQEAETLRGKLRYSEKIPSIHEWSKDGSTLFDGCISWMLMVDRLARPTAADVWKYCRQAHPS